MEINKDAFWLRKIKKDINKNTQEEQTSTSTDFPGLTEEDIEEDSELEGPWTRWGPRVQAKEF